MVKTIPAEWQIVQKQNTKCNDFNALQKHIASPSTVGTLLLWTLL